MANHRQFRRPSHRPVWLLSGFVLLLAMAFGAGPKQKSVKPAAADDAPTDKVIKSLAQWKKQLTKEQFRVTRQKGTEPAFSGKYWKTKKDGIYECVCCGQPLFDSGTKFDSGTGWPSFWKVIAPEAVTQHKDVSQAEVRTEILCSRCDAHLGHVFNDGPAPTGLRFCMNSAALNRVDREKASEEESKPAEATPK